MEKDVLEKNYDLFVSKVEGKFNLDDYSPNYRKLDGSLTVIVNNNELYIEFYNERTTVIIDERNKDRVVIPLYFDEGEWVVAANSDWNPTNKDISFNENYLNRILSYFEAISK